jgi:sn-glycerol 3-phosphate transport system permease protein
VTAVSDLVPERVIPRRDRPLSRKNLIATITTGYLPIVLATLVVVLPLVWMILASFKSPGELLTQTPSACLSAGCS